MSRIIKVLYRQAISEEPTHHATRTFQLTELESSKEVGLKGRRRSHYLRTLAGRLW